MEEVQRALCTLFDGIGERLFLNRVPAATEKGLASYVVISTKEMVLDLGAYKKTYLSVTAVVKDRDDGREDSAALDEMTEKILDVFPIVVGRFRCISPEVSYGGAITGFSYTTVTADMIIE
jgi:hypothetical protein